MVDFIRAASGLAFDDSDKQRRYETISFDSIRAEVKEIKVLTQNNWACFHVFLTNWHGISK